MQQRSEELRGAGKRIGVVPTMGYLHEGHLSLIRIAKANSDVVITTIFVNPTQFAADEDYHQYPRDFERDRLLAETSGSNILFLPDERAMYPTGYETYVTVDHFTQVLEGEFRPTHFKGVATIVAKLFHITQPHVAIFGQKDAQQVIVIKRMAEDLNFNIKIIVGPTVRESDGIAMSSRNKYLSNSERRDALVISLSLFQAEKMIRGGTRDIKKIMDTIEDKFKAIPSVVPDYIAIVHDDTLQPVETIKAGESVLIAIAARVGSTRLIDNIRVEI